jgi:hypothetical protein
MRHIGSDPRRVGAPARIKSAVAIVDARPSLLGLGMTQQEQTHGVAPND